MDGEPAIPPISSICPRACQRISALIDSEARIQPFGREGCCSAGQVRARYFAGDTSLCPIDRGVGAVSVEFGERQCQVLTIAVEAAADRESQTEKSREYVLPNRDFLCGQTDRLTLA